MEKPILFSEAMVNAILKGHKLQTRRVVKEKDFDLEIEACPYGQVGDHLWVRETCYLHKFEGTILRAHYLDGQHVIHWPGRAPDQQWHWRPISATEHDTGYRKTPNIHVPRQFSRITLEIVRVWRENLTSISEEDAQMEGIVIPGSDTTGYMHRIGFEQLWESIHGEGSWDEDPDVWVIEFKVIKKNELTKAKN